MKDGFDGKLCDHKGEGADDEKGVTHVDAVKGVEAARRGQSLALWSEVGKEAAST